MDFRRLKYYRHNALMLIVSADQHILTTITQYLGSERYSFITETSGERAWEIILHKKPAIVLADWHIPDVSGVALCHRVKVNLEHPDLMTTYFVLIVDALNNQQRQIGLDAGVDEFLSNSIDGSELRARLRTGLKVSALTQSLIWTNQKLLAQNDLLDTLNLVDPLTKALSEQAFVEIVPKMMQLFKGYGAYQSYSFLSLLIIDIDRFQPIVDSYGEQVGNETLKAIVGRLSNNCEANSLIYRYGLDEFACITPHNDAASGKQLSQNLLASISSHPISVSSALLFPLTISVGGVVTTLASLSQQNLDRSFGKLVALAEHSLHQAQCAGGNQDYIKELI
ncbi:diguanylate cyclase [Pseudanabaena sp. UWO310]|uniref:GGDEF domain-containing response regulator n=1 Tax=Pseudanabaena sp. UWO310 TaxID=2480795 RepID=UPI00168008E0|nr:diguanylate cyclase [Pseudanabaena sp. UWO310]